MEYVISDKSMHEALSDLTPVELNALCAALGCCHSDMVAKQIKENICKHVASTLSELELLEYPRIVEVNRTKLLLALQSTMREWPEFSGHPVYPVPCPDKGNPRTRFKSALDVPGGMWEGEYGAARTRLLEWVCEVVSDWKREMDACVEGLMGVARAIIEEGE